MILSISLRLKPFSPLCRSNHFNPNGWPPRRRTRPHACTCAPAGVFLPSQPLPGPHSGAQAATKGYRPGNSKPQAQKTEGRLPVCLAHQTEYPPHRNYFTPVISSATSISLAAANVLTHIEGTRSIYSGRGVPVSHIGSIHWIAIDKREGKVAVQFRAELVPLNTTHSDPSGKAPSQHSEITNKKEDFP